MRERAVRSGRVAQLGESTGFLTRGSGVQIPPRPSLAGSRAGPALPRSAAAGVPTARARARRIVRNRNNLSGSRRRVTGTSARSPSVSGDATIAILREAFLGLRRHQRAILRDLHIPYTEWVALDMCVRAPTRGRDLCETTGVTPSGGTTLIQRLVRRGWVARAREPADRRAIRLTATAAGRRIHAHGKRTMLRLLRDVTTRMTPGELAALERGLTGLSRALAAPP